MKQLYLGIDTSNYTTSVALTDSEGNILADERTMLKVKDGELGLRQSDALFQHWSNLPELLDAVLDGRDDLIEAVPEHSGLSEPTDRVGRIVAVCASSRPRPVEDSYMPVFTAGMNAARIIASATGAKLLFCSHQEGHLEAAARRTALERDKPFIFAHLSGGTLELLLVRGELYEAIFATKDLSYGQLLDRFGLALGFAFPAGARVDELALEHSPKGHENPLCRVFVQEAGLNLSGIETQLKSAINKYSPEDLAFFLMERISENFIEICENAKKSSGAKQVLVSGGVARSEFLRKRCEHKGYIFGDKTLCNDNAVGVAIYGGRHWR